MMGLSKQERLDKRLVRAASVGYCDAIRDVLAEGADVNARDTRSYHDSRPPLSCAIVNGHTPAALLLIESGADIHKADGQGCTPLIYAANKKNEYMVRHLLLKGADPKTRTSDGVSTLDMARSNSNLAIVRLIEGGKEAAEKSLAAETAPKKAPQHPSDHDDGAQLAAALNPEAESERRRAARARLKAKMAALHVPAPLQPDAQEILLERKVGDLVLQELFNFSARERLTFVRLGEGGPVQAFTRENFADIAAKSVIRVAFDEYRRRGGTMNEAEALSPGLEMPKPKMDAAPKL